MNLSLARHIAGYRSLGKLEQPQLSAGEEVFVYGEFEGFQNIPLAHRLDARPASLPSYRRSFAASTALFDSHGELIDRKSLLLAGQATEIADRPEKPVYFWGRFQVPPESARGNYRLEVLAVDLESRATSTASVAFTVSGAGSQ
jgi:hypothetical protein